jgi:chromosome segregation ATPase
MNDLTPDRLHNNPPDPLDEALAPYGDHISEAESWLDGSPVENEGQMKAVDALLKQVKSAKKDVTAAQKSESAPLHDAWKACLARYKPTIDDLDRMAKGLAALADGFKRKLAAEKAAKEREAWEAANKARQEAEAKAAAADTANIEAQREAEEAKKAAQEAEKAAQAAKRDTASVKGLRTVTKHEITDHKAALHWIAVNDRDAMTAFIEAYVAKNCKTAQIDGVKVWQDREAF